MDMIFFLAGCIAIFSDRLRDVTKLFTFTRHPLLLLVYNFLFEIFVRLSIASDY